MFCVVFFLFGDLRARRLCAPQLARLTVCPGLAIPEERQDGAFSEGGTVRPAAPLTLTENCCQSSVKIDLPEAMVLLFRHFAFQRNDTRVME